MMKGEKMCVLSPNPPDESGSMGFMFCCGLGNDASVKCSLYGCIWVSCLKQV